MADPIGQSPSNLASDLLNKGHEYSFVQAMRLLRILGYVPESIEDTSTDNRRKQPLRIRPANNLSFPATDIARIEKAAGEKAGAVMTASFLGLYGPASPLPCFYTEDLMQEEAHDDLVGRDFLDIFNHRLFTLFFRCCMKYRLFFRIVEEKNTEDIERLFCLIGLGETIHQEGLPDPYALLRYSGLLNQHPRSALGLETLLRDALNDVPIKVIQCFRRLVKIPTEQRMLLGRTGSSLGVDSTIGEEIEDYTGKFRLRVGPVNLTQFPEFLPQGNSYKKLEMLTRLYLQDPLEYDMEVITKQREVSTVCLGASSLSNLGWDTWIFSGEKIGEVQAVFPIN